MKVVFSERAKKDVQEIAQYIAQENRDAAIRFVERVEKTSGLLREFPKMGHQAPFDLMENLRTIRVTHFPNHNIFYRIESKRIRIDRVVNIQRNLPYLFSYTQEI